MTNSAIPSYMFFNDDEAREQYIDQDIIGDEGISTKKVFKSEVTQNEGLDNTETSVCSQARK